MKIKRENFDDFDEYLESLYWQWLDKELGKIEKALKKAIQS